jgi:hypothetical protein
MCAAKQGNLMCVLRRLNRFSFLRPVRMYEICAFFSTRRSFYWNGIMYSSTHRRAKSDPSSSLLGKFASVSRIYQ